MRKTIANAVRRSLCGFLILAVSLMPVMMPVSASAQDRLKTMPGYEQFQKMNGQIAGSVKLGLTCS